MLFITRVALVMVWVHSSKTPRQHRSSVLSVIGIKIQSVKERDSAPEAINTQKKE